MNCTISYWHTPTQVGAGMQPAVEHVKAVLPPPEDPRFLEQVVLFDLDRMQMADYAVVITDTGEQWVVKSRWSLRETPYRSNV